MLKCPLLVRLLWLGPFQVTEARGRPQTLHLRVTLSPLSHVTSLRGTRNSGGTGKNKRVGVRRVGSGLAASLRLTAVTTVHSAAIIYLEKLKLKLDSTDPHEVAAAADFSHISFYYLLSVWCIYRNILYQKKKNKNKTIIFPCSYVQHQHVFSSPLKAFCQKNASITVNNEKKKWTTYRRRCSLGLEAGTEEKK